MRCCSLRAEGGTRMFAGLLLALVVGLVWAIALLAGAVVLWRGLRGRVMDDHVRCRRCRYDLAGTPKRPDICPECGTTLLGPRRVVIGRRRIAAPATTAGLAIVLVLGAAPVLCAKLPVAAAPPPAAVARGVAAPLPRAPRRAGRSAASESSPFRRTRGFDSGVSVSSTRSHRLAGLPVVQPGLGIADVTAEAAAHAGEHTALLSFKGGVVPSPPLNDKLRVDQLRVDLLGRHGLAARPFTAPLASRSKLRRTIGPGIRPLPTVGRGPVPSGALKARVSAPRVKSRVTTTRQTPSR